jgi:hypothetical protein
MPWAKELKYSSRELKKQEIMISFGKLITRLPEYISAL